jgi:hypothetical protein
MPNMLPPSYSLYPNIFSNGVFNFAQGLRAVWSRLLLRHFNVVILMLAKESAVRVV